MSVFDYDVRISELPPIGTPSGTECFAVDDGEDTYSITYAALIAAAGGGGGGGGVTVTTEAGTSHTLAAGDDGTILLCTNSTGCDVTLPSASSGLHFTVGKLAASSSVIILPSGGATINGASYYAPASQYSFASFVCDGTNWFVYAMA
jgi:hypothetical protein